MKVKVISTCKEIWRKTNNTDQDTLENSYNDEAIT